MLHRHRGLRQIAKTADSAANSADEPVTQKKYRENAVQVLASAQRQWHCPCILSASNRRAAEQVCTGD
jgi:hypothetical protein